MSTEHSLLQSSRLLQVEALVVILSSPLLILPSTLPIATYCAIGLLFIVWLIARVWEKRYFVPLSPLRFPCLIVICSTLIGILVSADPSLTFPKATGLLLGFAWWRLLTKLTNNKTDLKINLLFCILVWLAITAIGLLNSKQVITLLPLPQISNSLILRLGTILGNSDSGINANQLSGTLLLFVPLLVALGFDKAQYSRLTRITFAIIVIATIPILYITQSRSGWIGAFVGFISVIIVSTAIYYQISVYRTAIVGILFVLGGSILLQRQLIALLSEATLVETTSGAVRSLTLRQEIWHWGVVAVGDFPFTGIGLGTFRAAVYRLYPIDFPIGFDFAHAHNVFLQIALDIGLIGLIAYIAILLICGWMCITLIQQSVPDHALSIGILSSLIAFHVYGLADTLALGSKSGIILWMSLGLLTGRYVSVFGTSSVLRPK